MLRTTLSALAVGLALAVAPGLAAERHPNIRVVNQELVYPVSEEVAYARHVPLAAQTPGVVVVAPLPLYTEDGIEPVFPYMHSDPAWKLCQFGRDVRGRRATHCGPYSYHPYGLFGYRPFGTYRPYRPGPVYGEAPGARVIELQSVR
jgi:hypothetical protein